MATPCEKGLENETLAAGPGRLEGIDVWMFGLKSEKRVDLEQEKHGKLFTLKTNFDVYTMLVYISKRCHPSV